ncbi:MULTISPECIES: LysR family transcriptional regulator [unclassified Brevundimonas]|uniref:LysR family transcriptional regulator n=1 Tax=unclassified Brevundimonas TaxID=2622653 RepID=UPI0025BE7F98|nr:MULTISPECIES: LysR family transcriptional regulator [unclassified Brevundimonas]
MLKRSHVRQFLAVVDSGSFTAAAARVRITQPTLSVGIAEMEKTVGAKLFIRDRKHVRLTEAGARLLPIARQLEQGFRTAESLNAPARDSWPHIRLGVLRTLAPRLVRRAVSALKPDMEPELVEGSAHELRNAMAAGRIDAALTLLRADDPQELALFTEPYVMLAPRYHRLAGQRDVPPEELASEIMIARRACERLQDTSRFFTHSGVRPRFALRSDNDALCLSMVESGLGITTAPLSLQSDDMSQIGIRGYNFERTIGIAVSPALTDPRAMWNRLRSVVSTAPDA